MRVSFVPVSFYFFSTASNIYNFSPIVNELLLLPPLFLPFFLATVAGEFGAVCYTVGACVIGKVEAITSGVGDGLGLSG